MPLLLEKRFASTPHVDVLYTIFFKFLGNLTSAITSTASLWRAFVALCSSVKWLQKPSFDLQKHLTSPLGHIPPGFQSGKSVHPTQNMKLRRCV